jgi:precorrin-2 dehydrogenase/sirohydrochlorin ferrochelatase
MAKYPIFLELAGKRVVVIGAGAVAVRKVQDVLEAGARVVVIAESVESLMPLQTSGANIELIKSKYSKDYLAGALLVIATTNRPNLNRQIYKDCQQLKILCNVVDNTQLCDFFVPAVVKRGNLQIAVSTGGDCPAYAGHIRQKLEHIFTEDHGRFLAELEKIRNTIIKSTPDPAQRKILLGRLVNDDSFDYFVGNGPDKWQKWAQENVTQKKKE